MSAKLSDLRRKLVGAAEQPDVAGKRSRTSRFQSPQSFAASKRSVRAVHPRGRRARHSLDAIATLPEHRWIDRTDRYHLEVTLRGGGAQVPVSPAATLLRLPPAYRRRQSSLHGRCAPFAILFLALSNHFLDTSSSSIGRRASSIDSCSLAQRSEERPPLRRPKLGRPACLTIPQQSRGSTEQKLGVRPAPSRDCRVSICQHH